MAAAVASWNLKKCSGLQGGLPNSPKQEFPQNACRGVSPCGLPPHRSAPCACTHSSLAPPSRLIPPQCCLIPSSYRLMLCLPPASYRPNTASYCPPSRLTPRPRRPPNAQLNNVDEHGLSPSVPYLKGLRNGDIATSRIKQVRAPTPLGCPIIVGCSPTVPSLGSVQSKKYSNQDQVRGLELWVLPLPPCLWGLRWSGGAPKCRRSGTLHIRLADSDAQLWRCAWSPVQRGVEWGSVEFKSTSMEPNHGTPAGGQRPLWRDPRVRGQRRPAGDQDRAGRQARCARTADDQSALCGSLAWHRDPRSALCVCAACLRALQPRAAARPKPPRCSCLRVRLPTAPHAPHERSS